MVITAVIQPLVHGLLPMAGERGFIL
jgi:hypothetical protein